MWPAAASDRGHRGAANDGAVDDMDRPILIVLIALPVTSAVVGYRLGHSTGARFKGLVLGLLLGPIGLLPMLEDDSKAKT